MSFQEPIPVRLVEASPLAPDVRHCVFERSDKAEFSFEPGQYVCLAAEIDGETQKRYYSIASAPSGDARFELCIKASPEGFGRFLTDMPSGTELSCEGPGGEMRLRTPPRDSLFVASGTGVSAMRSMVQRLLGGDLDRADGGSATLLLGARSAEGLLYRDEFEALAARRPNFTFMPTLTGANHDWRGLRGRVLDHLEEALGGRTDLDVYLCGHPEMVADARKRLAAAGFDEHSVVYEKY